MGSQRNTSQGQLYNNEDYMYNQIDQMRKTENVSSPNGSNIMARLSQNIKAAYKKSDRVIPNESYEPDAESSIRGSLE